MKEIVDIKNGSIVRTKNIGSEGQCWIFKNADPQIFIKFETPVHGLKIKCKMGQADFTESTSTIYYRTANEEYSEKKTCKIPFMPEKEIEREIWFEFSEGITEIRYDPAEIQGKCCVEKISFTTVTPGEMEEVFSEYDFSERKGVLLFTHELSMTGAPILAFHISKCLKDAGYNVLVFSKQKGPSPLEDKFKENGMPVIEPAQWDGPEYACVRIGSDFQPRTLSAEEYLRVLLKNLRKRGISAALTNTIVTGEYTELLKDYRYQIVSLIHEMKTTIEHYGFKTMGEMIARYSDYIIFPNEYVKKDFQQLYPEIKGECLIKPQGVYMSDDFQKRVMVLDAYGIETNDFVIMSSGTCELRKGVDLFVDAAMILLAQNPTKRIKFIWTGNFGQNTELECWLKSQLERSSLAEAVQFIPFIKDQEEYRKILRRADTFWALSREDPFPSTVLEAMKNRVPVLGFKNTGGIQEMLSDGRGILVDGFDLSGLVLGTERIMQASDMSGMLDKAQTYVDRLTFDSYIDFLTETFSKDMQVFPKLDLSVWEKDTHFYGQQHQLEPVNVRQKRLQKIRLTDKMRRKNREGGV